MLLSKLKKKKAAPPVENRLSKKVHAVLQWVAAYLQQYTSKLPMRTLRYGMFAFCMLSVGMCGWVAIQSFYNSKTTVLNITPLQANSHSLKTGEETLKPGNPITEKEYIQIRYFRRYLDSLRQTPRGRRVYFRLLYNRRGLLDSLRKVETLYHIQQHAKQ
jgi:hypothetical protein